MTRSHANVCAGAPLLRLLVLALLTAGGAGQDLMTPELLWKLRRVEGGAISPDGSQVLYGVRTYDLAENKGDSDLYLVPLGGGAARALTSGGGPEMEAQWTKTPRGVRVWFLSSRSGSPQVYALDPADGSQLQVTDVEGGVANLRVAPGGERIAFTVDVKLDPTVKDIYPDLPKADARIIDGLLYRHWSAWHDYAYSHLHVARIGEDGRATDLVDLMEGLRADCPLPPFGGSEQIAWSPDGLTIAYTAKVVNDPARSTDSDIYLRRLEGDDARTLCLTPGMDGYDLEPRFSPDGRKLAFLSLSRPGFESDRSRIMVHDLEADTTVEITEGLDASAHEVRWSPDGRSVLFTMPSHGTEVLARLPVEGEARKLEALAGGACNWSLRDISPDGRTLLLARQDMIRPPELYVLEEGSDTPRKLTGENDAIYAKLALPEVKERWIRSSDGAYVQCWVVLPPGFDRERRYPMLTFCQGGPQVAVSQAFSYRWNFHLMAAKGYVVLAPNRRGVPGFGQAWVDAISMDWGGQPMDDLLAATDDLVLEPWIDQDRVAAVGASFGGYTIYWLMGNAPDRFRAMIAHCGVFNLESMYGATEELFFVDWDLGGPYWRNPQIQELYDRFSPHRFVGSWRTPLLVIHGEKDFRVPVTQGMEAFTAAQVQGVPSRFLYFPGEGHWVLSPQNSVLWQRVYFDWLERHLAARAAPGAR